jgi:hypothetical protein
MAYLQQNDPNLTTDVLTRKEYYWSKRWKNTRDDNFLNDIIPRFLLEESIERSMNLKISSYQMFVQNYINPSTPYSRLLLKWSTGSGKTIGALSIAMNFIERYRLEKEIGNVEIGSVFIIGFSERAFKNELLAHPEFGFLSRDERRKLDKLKKLAAVGSKQDIERFHDMVTKIKKRFSSRKGNGFFKFYGYKAFVNRIFKASKDVNLNDLSEEKIRIALAQGKISYDEELLAQFKNSIIICDEIHNVYNSQEKNNWGIAIQAVLDREPTCRAVFASATPFSNSPTEIVDLLNLLLPASYRLNKSDLFDANNKLKPSALDKIAELCKGRISYLQDINPKYYPSVSMEGESLKEIPYLKFIRCPMSDFHYKTYKQIYTGALSQDSQYLVDFALENPDGGLGIFQTNQIRNALTSAPQKWKDRYGLNFVDGKITGDALRRDKLGKYSTKYVAMLDHISDIIKKSGGKIFIYHNIVHMSGVLFIEQVLLKNGYLDEFSASNENTICMKCGKPKKDHSYEEIVGGEDVLVDITGNTIVDTTGNTTGNSQGNVNGNTQGNVNGNTQGNIQGNTQGNTLDITGGKSDDSNYIKLVKKSNSIDWIRLEQYMLTLKKQKVDGKSQYYIPASGMHNNVINGQSHTMRDIATVFDSLQNIPILVQVPNYAPRFGEWLLQMGFKLQNQKGSYSYLLWKPEKRRVGGDDTNGINVVNTRVETVGDNIVDTTADTQNDDTSNIAGGKAKSKSKHTHKHKKTKLPNKFREKNKKLNPSVTDTTETIVNISKHQRSRHGQQKHKYTPVRFVMAHSDIDKSLMDHSIEKFNNPDNTDGNRFMILVGSRIIKESYNTKAIRNEFIMGRPDNIPTLIQIRGRAVRKDSHKLLPIDKRHVSMYIFTSCLPEKQKSGVDKGKYKLSYEEIKYKEKIAAYKVMQEIEKVMHENAIDSFINNDMHADDTAQIKDALGPLPFKPAIDKKFDKELSLSQLNLSTFDIYHADREVEFIKVIIKRLFIEMSSVWEYNDLFEAVKNPLDYETEINTQLFTEENFLIAIDQLSWNNDSKFVEPLMRKNTSDSIDAETSSMSHNGHPSYVIDRLYDANDKVISLPGGQDSIIVPIHEGSVQYYILFPVNSTNNEPEIDIELPYRVVKQEQRKSINMNHFIQTKRIDFDYDDKKRIFYQKYRDTSIENMENVICEYGTNFHIKFLEECVEYVFRTWTDPTLEKAEYHEFFFKMLYYYDLLSLVMWAYTTKPRIFKEYSKYAIPVRAKDIKLKAMSRYEKRKEELDDISPEDNSDLATSGVINLLKSSINRTSNVWVPMEFREQFNKTVEQSLALFLGRKKRSKVVNKVSADLLPIGHFISKFPRLYSPQHKSWTEDPTYAQADQAYIENNIIIGYNDKSQNGTHVRFKMREPIHNIKKYKDTRLISRGVVCKSKSKVELKKLAKKLDVVLPDDERINVEELCVLVRSKLIRLELKERIKKSKIKWFYNFWENSSA